MDDLDEYSPLVCPKCLGEGNPNGERCLACAGTGGNLEEDGHLSLILAGKLKNGEIA